MRTLAEKGKERGWEESEEGGRGKTKGRRGGRREFNLCPRKKKEKSGLMYMYIRLRTAKTV